MIPAIAPNDAVVVAYRRTPDRTRPQGIAGRGAARRPCAGRNRAESLTATPQLDSAEFADAYVGCAVPQGRRATTSAAGSWSWRGWTSVPAVTVNRFCASSLQATAMAAQAVRAGDGDAFLVARRRIDVLDAARGPLHTPPLRTRGGAPNELFESGGSNGSTPGISGGCPMCTSTWAKPPSSWHVQTGTTRQDQDEWALESQLRAARAIEAGYFAREIVPVTTADGSVVTADDGPRPSTTMEALVRAEARVPRSGTVTAGNASPLNDGASALVVMSARRGPRNWGSRRWPASWGPRPAGSPRRSWGWARWRLPPAPGPTRPVDRRHRHRRTERGLRRPSGARCTPARGATRRR